MTASIEEKENWHASFGARLKASKLYKEFKAREAGDDYFVHLDASLLNAIQFACDRSKLIVKSLPQFTLHDADHLFNVLTNMGNIIPEETLNKLGIVDIYLLIVCSFFHDLGLAPTEREVDSWRNSLTSNYSPKNAPKDSISNFISARPDVLKKLLDLRSTPENKELMQLENSVIQSYIRETHGSRLPDVIGKYKDLVYRNFKLTQVVSEICESHVRDTSAIGRMESIVICGQNQFFCPPFIAVILRLADLLDYDTKRTPNVLFDAMGIDDPVSKFEWRKQRSIIAWNIKPNLIQVRASCDHPSIEAGIKEFCDYVDQELLQCGFQLKKIHHPHIPVPAHYKLNLPSSVDTSGVGPEKRSNGSPLYSYSPTRFTLDKNKVIDLLMGTSLYGNPAVALRELLQNSFDACLSRSKFEERWDGRYVPKVTVIFKKNDDIHTLTVIDNGMGMDEDIIKRFYSKVGASYYKSAEFYKLLASNDVEYTPISRFGIGVLSYFLVANSLSVYSTRKLGRNKLAVPVLVKVDGVNGVFWISETDREEEVGTETTLNLLPSNPWSSMERSNLIREIKSIIPEPPFPIRIVVDGEILEYGGDKQRSGSPHDRLTSLDSSVEWPIFTDIFFDDKKKGYSIDADVYWIEEKSVPVSERIYFESEISVANQLGSLRMKNSLESRTNRITKWSTSLNTVNGVVVPVRSYQNIIGSQLELSLHGFDVPFDPFSDAAGDRFGCVLKFPFVICGRFMIRSPSDLTLNAARDRILADALWYEAKMWLTNVVVERVFKRVSKKTAISLAKLWLSRSEDEVLTRVLSKYKS